MTERERLLNPAPAAIRMELKLVLTVVGILVVVVFLHGGVCVGERMGRRCRVG